MNSKEERKRAAERAVFEGFLRCATWAKIGKHEFRNGNPPDEPDIVVEADGRSIGVEITGTDVPSLQSRETLESKIVEHARKTYETNGGPPVAVKIRGLMVSDCKMVSAIGDALASLTLKNLPQTGRSAVALWDETDSSLGDALDSISIGRWIGLPHSFWSVGSARFVPPVSPETIQSHIDRKNLKTRFYRTQYHERWLLLNGAHFEAWGELTSECRSAKYASSFERVFYIGTGYSNVVEFRIHP